MISDSLTHATIPNNSEKMAMIAPALNGTYPTKKQMKKKDRDSPINSFIVPNRGIRNTSELLTEKNIEELSTKTNLGVEQKAFKEVHNSRNILPKNEGLLAPMKTLEVYGIGLNSKKSDKGKILEVERQDFDKNELKIMEMVGLDPDVSTDCSTKGVMSTQDKDGNSNLWLCSQKEDWADEDNKPTDFSKPIPGMPNLPAPQKESTEIVSDIQEKVRTAVKILSASKKHGKTCWWWRKGRCHHGDKCWFEHNSGDTEAVRGSLRSPSIERKGRKQIHDTNPNHLSGTYRSPRERERDKCSHSWRKGEVMVLTMRVLWKLGRELKLVWPVDTKREELINLIIARLRVVDNLKVSSGKHIMKPTIRGGMSNGAIQDGKNVEL